MSHACTTAGDERGVWVYCADCDWLGPVYTVDQNHGSANSSSGSTPTSTSTSTYRYQQDFKASENDARTQERGLWSPSACAV